MIGPARRRLNRHHKETQFERATAEAFAKLVGGASAEIARSQTKLDTYYGEIARIRDGIRSSSHGPAFKYRLNRLLAESSANWLSDFGLDANTFEAPARIGRKQDRRSQHGFGQLRRHDRVEGKFRQRLAMLAKTNSTDVAAWIALTLWSAATRAGLLDPALVEAFQGQLQRGKPDLKSVYIDLRWRKPKGDGDPLVAVRLCLGEGEQTTGPYNQRNASGMLERVEYWQPDPLTLSLMARCLAFSTGSKSSTADMLNAAVHEAVNDLLEFERRRLPGSILRDLVSLARWATDRDLALDYPEAMITALGGTEWQCVGYNDHMFEILYGGQPGSSTASQSPALAAKQPGPAETAASPTFSELEGIIAAAYHHNTHARLRRDLEAFSQSGPRPDVTALLGHWLCNLAKRSRSISTIRTYFYRVGSRLYDEFGLEDLTSIDKDDFAERYETLLGAIDHEPHTVGLTAQTLDWFHKYACRACPGIDLLDVSLWRGDRLHLVRSQFVPVWILRRAFFQIDQLTDVDTANAVKWCMMLSYRTGLRRTEVCKVRPRDLEQSDEFWLFVTANAYGRQKTRAANRKLKLGGVLTPSEKAWAVKRVAKCPEEHLPVIWQLARRKISAQEIGLKVNAALRLATGNESWTFHHLRHSAANALMLVAFDEHALCEKWFGWDLTQQANVLRAFAVSANARQGRFAGLGTFMGHANVGQTFESYTHTVRDVASQRWRKRRIQPKDLRLIDLLVPDIKRDKRVRLNGTAILPKLIENLVPWCTAAAELESTTDMPPEPRAPKLATAEDFAHFALGRFHDALKRINQGQSLSVVSQTTWIPAQLLETAIREGQSLAQRVSNQGVCRIRLIKPASPYGAFLPSIPTRQAAKAEALTFLERFRDYARDDVSRERLQWMINYSIDHSERDHGGICFRDAAIAMQFVNILMELGISSDRFHMNFQLARDSDLPGWLEKLPIISYRKAPSREGLSSRAKGRAFLCICSSNDGMRKKSLAWMSEGWRPAVSIFYIFLKNATI